MMCRPSGPFYLIDRTPGPHGPGRGCIDPPGLSRSERHMPSTRREILPSSMHTPWAGSNRYKISELMSFTAGRLLPVDSPSLPFCVRFNEPLRRRRQHYGFTSPYRHAATLDNGPLAKSYPCGSHTRLSSNHFQSARAFYR